MAEPKKKTIEEEVFEDFGITDPEDQKQVKLSAATRVLAAKKLGDKDSKKRLW